DATPETVGAVASLLHPTRLAGLAEFMKPAAAQRLREIAAALSGVPEHLGATPTAAVTVREAPAYDPRTARLSTGRPPLELDLNRTRADNATPEGDPAGPADGGSNSAPPENSAPHQDPESDPTWRQRRMQDELELARLLYNRPESRHAAVAVLDRLREVLVGLHPEATTAQIDAAFYAHTNTLWGGMVLPAVSFEELRRDGNLRELMSAILNATIRNAELKSPSGTTMNDGIAKLLNQPGWETRAAELGLNVDALARMRARIVAADLGRPIKAEDLRNVAYQIVDTPEAHALLDEYERSRADNPLRSDTEAVRRHLTVQDWALMGMPLSQRELEAVPGELEALRK
ncbi:hypothetical protein, partial [Streptomyces roseolus]|uniref:hypothetical protein n=1 Tax=Streptomyces roseolus TaxID=67358 RepID=UPI00364BD02C